MSVPQEELEVLAGLLSPSDPMARRPSPLLVSKLSGRGCSIEQSGVADFYLRDVSIELWQDYLDWSLARGPLLNQIDIHIYRQTASTQDIAKQLGTEPAVVIADQQTAGRGRLGRQWQSESGSCVLMSIRWPKSLLDITHDRLSLISGLVVARITERLLPESRVRMKWPNDVMVDGRKIAGILIETTSNAFIIGIGLNVCSTPTLSSESNGATSLREAGSQIHRLAVIESILIDLQLRFGQSLASLEGWQPLAAVGTIQTFEQAGQRITGEVLDLDPDHGLIVRRNTGEILTLPAATTSVIK
ncbi:MAG: biotin--[acetyl-CoA-carboxylase] ligase [Planctomycetota bacterium]